MGERELGDALAGENRRATLAHIAEYEAELAHNDGLPSSAAIDGDDRPIPPDEMAELLERTWSKIEETHRKEGET